MTFGQGPEMTLTLNAHIPSLTQLVVCILQLSGIITFKPKLQNLTLP